MKDILRLENELRINKVNLAKLVEINTDVSHKEMRALVLQRSNLKDMLLNAYRSEMMEQRKDMDYLAEMTEQTFVVKG